MLERISDIEDVLHSAALDPLFSARILSLYYSYHHIDDMVDVFRNESGALACRFGAGLIISGEHSFEELVQFAELFGIRSIEGRAPTVLPPQVRSRRFYSSVSPLMVYHGKADSIPPLPPNSVDTSPEVSDVYDIVVNSDPNFRSDRLMWMSDLSYRSGRGYAQVYTFFDNASTAGLYFTDDAHAVIGGVCTLPKHRGKGYAKRATLFCVKEAIKQGLTPLLIAADDSLERFYSSLGFETTNKHIIIKLTGR